MTDTDIAYSGGLASQRLITAFFDSYTDASEAVERLVVAGIPRSSITLVRGAESTTSGMGSDRNEGSFWDSLKDLFMPDDDRSLYAEGLRRGGHVVTVRTSDALYDRALDILDDEGTVDLEERQSSWRSEGWTGANAGLSSGRSGSYGSTGSLGGTGSAYGSAGALGAAGSSGLSGAGSSGLGSAYAADRSYRGDGEEEVIPVVEEELRVGKRDVSHGRVRVRSYTVETPVSETVDLREEHVTVQRRPVDRPLTGTEPLFEDRTIELDERAEEAVVAKEARVREELVIRKDVEHRTDRITDTVRRTEVDVEDDRGAKIR